MTLPGHSSGGLPGAIPRAEPTGPHTQLNISSPLSRPNFQSPLPCPCQSSFNSVLSSNSLGMQLWQTHKKVLLPCPATGTLMGKPNKKNKHRGCDSVHSAMANAGFHLLGVGRTEFCLPCDRSDQDFPEGALTRTIRGNKDLSFMSGKHGSLDADP